MRESSAPKQSQNPRNSRGRPRETSAKDQTNTVQSLDRALTVLTLLAQDGQMSLSAVSARLAIPTATAYRILVTLQKHGYVQFDETSQNWMIGVEAYRTGSTYLQRTDLVEVSRPIMRGLMEQTGETANLAVRDSDHVVFVGQIETSRPIRAYFNPGTRTPMFASGIGKALLAAMTPAQLERLLRNAQFEKYTDNTLSNHDMLRKDLDQTALRGWSFDCEERFDGMSCIGSAIYNENGDAIAGVSVSGPSVRFSDGDVDAIGPLVKQAALEISIAIGGKPR